MPNEVILMYKKTTKNTHVFSFMGSSDPLKANPVCKEIYLQKTAMPEAPKAVKVTVDVVA